MFIQGATFIPDSRVGPQLSILSPWQKSCYEYIKHMFVQQWLLSFWATMNFRKGHNNTLGTYPLQILILLLRHQRNYQVGFNHAAINTGHFISIIDSSSGCPERFRDFSCIKFPFKTKQKVLSHVNSFWSDIYKKCQKWF